ncbi:MAG: SOS response-associated peptidase family protein [Clostridia bacterium]|nr:SOS response-associated peptidase family protein [Clostridia bacterium]
MCCRYSFRGDSPDERVQKIVSLMERDYPGQFKMGEIFPGDTTAAILGADGRLRHTPAAFGFPGFKGGRLILNARMETAAEKPTFAGCLRQRRMILPADGFYEWSRGEDKTKYLFTLNGRRTLYLCGLYQEIEGTYHFVILTRPANESMTAIHDRMPVIASADEVRPYLTDYAAAVNIISAPAPQLCRQPTEKEEEKKEERIDPDET